MTSKNERKLILRISEQEEQLDKYKKRFQDLVAAHKKVISEKERAEENLKNVTSLLNPSEYTFTNNEDNNSYEVKQLAENLILLTDEKKKLESQFQVERKQFIQQISLLEKKLSSKTKIDEEPINFEIDDAKGQMHTESNQTELNFSPNIRELQNIIVSERQKRIEKENHIDELQKQLNEATNKLNRYSEKENYLLKELENLKNQIVVDNTSQVVLEMKKELHDLKGQNNFAVLQEQKRALNAEERARKLATEHEKRVFKLEQKLTQLSELACRYDKHRRGDQETIMALKSRVMQLEVENSNIKCEDDRSSTNEETLIQQLQHIKQRLIENSQDDMQLYSIKEILLQGLENVDSDSKYKQQYEMLKQQFEECMIKNALNVNEEYVKNLKHKIHHLKNKLLDYENTNMNLRREIESTNERTNEIIEEERQSWKKKIVSVTAENRNKCITLEKELEKQRERVKNILNEKEKELAELQQQYFPNFSSSEESSNDRITPGTHRQSSTLLYYLEETARKDADISKLRKNNNELKNQLHNLEKELFHQMQHYAMLQQEIQKIEKQNNCVEGMNNEYLKNVFLNYLTTVDMKMKSHILNAIFTILKFSDDEINRAMKLNQVVKTI